MQKRKLQACIFLMALPLTLMANDKGNSTYVKLTDNNLYDMVMKMSDKDVGELLTKKQSMLGGKCKVSENSNGLALFTLSVPGKDAPLRFGIKKPSGFSLKFSSMGITGFKKINIPHLAGRYSLRTEDERNIALKDLGAAFKSEISGRSWPCGSPQLESRRVSLADLKKEVKFYRDDQTGEVVCISPTGKDSSVRKPDSCEYEPVLAELPPKLCKYLVHLARSEAEDELTVGTRMVKKDGTKKVKLTVKLPIFLPFSNDFRRQITLARFLKKQPDTYSFIDHAHIPAADDFLSAETLELLGTEKGEAQDFANLPEEAKVELTRMALSVEAIRGESAIVQPSPEVLDIVDAVRPHADALIKANPDLELDLYTFPRRADVEENYQAKFASLTQINGKPYNLSLQCDRRPRFILKTAWIKNLLRRNIASTPTIYKLNTVRPFRLDDIKPIRLDYKMK